MKVHGPLDEAAVAAIAERLAESPAAAGFTLELADADADEGGPIATLAAALRDAARRGTDVLIFEAPNELAHTLYRIGALGPRLVLVDPRPPHGHAG